MLKKLVEYDLALKQLSRYLDNEVLFLVVVVASKRKLSRARPVGIFNVSFKFEKWS